MAKISIFFELRLIFPIFLCLFICFCYLCRVKILIRLLLLPWLLVACVVDEHDEEVDPDTSSIVRVGDQLPDFSIEVIDGVSRTLFNSKSFKGTSVIVFFHTGCTDCQRELPELNAYYLRHCQEPGFQMVAIAREESEESISAYWQQHNLSIPYSPQTDRRIYNLFATQFIPRVYLCSAQGIVLWMGVENFDLPD